MSEVKEAPAWAVVDKDGNNVLSRPNELSAHLQAEWHDFLEPKKSPHSVIRVRIVPDTEEQPTP